MSRSTDVETRATKCRIIEAGIRLFGLRGFDGTSTREICKEANVNIASLNYHFQSKDNLLVEVNNQVCEEFKHKIKSITPDQAGTAAEFAVAIFDLLTADGPRCLNQFKIFLDAQHSLELEPFPLGYEQFCYYFDKELKPTVPEHERLWVNSIVFSSTVHYAVVVSSPAGKMIVEKYFEGNLGMIRRYVTNLAEALIRDLNARY
jgi:hypothetical protein